MLYAILIAALVILYLTATTWERYLAIMALKRARDRGTLTTTSKVFGYPILARGVLMDVLYNVVVGTVIFVDVPREWMFTSRLQRYIRAGGWRGKVAYWMCHRLLNAYDPDGNHCA